MPFRPPRTTELLDLLDGYRDHLVRQPAPDRALIARIDQSRSFVDTWDRDVKEATSILRRGFDSPRARELQRDDPTRTHRPRTA